MKYLGLTAALIVLLGFSAASAHEVPYVEIIVLGDPAYVVNLGLGIKTIEERTIIPAGVSSRHWEFFNEGKTTFMTFFRWDPEQLKGGESFQVVLPKHIVPLEEEALRMLELVERATCWYRPDLSETCPVSGP
mgnify:CR=1 FL=1